MSPGYHTDRLHGNGVIKCWWFRWHACAPAGKWIGSLDMGGHLKNFVAVVDDFGTLVLMEAA